MPIPPAGSPGGAGTLFGGNALQVAIDALTRAVNDNTTAVNAMVGAGAGGRGRGGGPGGGGGAPGGGGAGFPGVNNPWRQNAQQGRGYNTATVGGSLGAIASSFIGFGRAQLSTQVGMSAYVQQASLSASPSMTFSQINNQLRYQAYGAGGRNTNALANSPLDAGQGQLVQNFVAGSPFPGMTSYGQNIIGAASAFGYTNPTLGYTGANNMAGAMYNPVTSLQMRQLGYGVTPRTLGGGSGAPTGNVIQGMLRRWYGTGSVKQQNLVASLSQGGKGLLNLQALGYNNQQISALAPTMESYNKLFQQGISSSRATTLFNEASKNNSGAQKTLAGLGITTSDQQSIKNYQAQQTGRTSDYSQGFNTGLQTSVGLLTQFNAVLSHIIKSSGLAGPLGFGGGVGAASSLMGGGLTSGLGVAGGIGLGRAVLGRIGGGAAGAAGGAGGGGILGGLGIGGAGAAALGGGVGAGVGLGMLLRALSDKAAPRGSAAGRYSNILQTSGNPLANLFGGFGGSLINMVSQGGGAASTATSAQGKGNKNSSNGGSITGQSIDAVHTAEKFLGTPYVYGGSNPSTGFDCSGLVQYAYGQAGVKLPRTSQQQWASLRRKSVGLKNVREGDIVFAAGSDGTPNAPGHEGLMVSSTELIQAPHTGADVQLIKYSPSDWSHAARPTGSLTGSGGSANGAGTPGGVGYGVQAGAAGNSGINMSESSVIGNNSETSALGGGGGFGSLSLGGGGGNTVGSSVGSGVTTPSNASARQAMSAAKKMAKKYGWSSGAQWNDLVKLWNRESNWQWNAANASGAYGIPQSLPGDKMASAGADWRTDAATQIKWGLGYIKQRYGSPSGAWGHELNVGWYAKGTKHARRGAAVVGENGPEVMMMSGGETIMPNSSLGRGMPPINITFAKGAIAVHGMSSSDSGASGRALADKFVEALSAEKIYDAIGLGEKN